MKICVESPDLGGGFFSSNYRSVVPGLGVDAPDDRPLSSGGLVSPLFSNMARRFLT